MLFFKKPRPAAKTPPENPYLMARKTFNDHSQALVNSQKTWQLIALLSLLLALSAVAGIIYIGSQSKYVPYVVEVDKLGQVRGAGLASQDIKVDTPIIKSTIAQFIENARLVTLDVNLQRSAIFSLYAHMIKGDPALRRMNDWLNGDPKRNPFVRARDELVNIEITSILQQSPGNWQVDWVETTRSRDGVQQGKSVNMRALVVIYQGPLAVDHEEQLLRNPFGLYIKDFSWSRVA